MGVQAREVASCSSESLCDARSTMLPACRCLHQQLTAYATVSLHLSCRVLIVVCHMLSPPSLLSPRFPVATT